MRLGSLQAPLRGDAVTRQTGTGRHVARRIAAALIPLLMVVTLATTAPAQQFQDQTTTRFPNPQLTEYSNQVAVADIDGDGDLDIAFANGSGFGSPQQMQRVRLFINDGTGNFTDETIARSGNTVSYARDVQFGDVDGDDDLDMVIANDFNTPPRLFLNDGVGFFTDVSSTQFPVMNLGSSHVALGDVDNDGDLDLWFTNGGASRFGSGQAQLWVNNGAGFFSNETASRLPAANVSEPMDAIFGDVDGDFDLDMVEGHRSTNQSRLYMNDGAGNFVNSPFPNDSSTYSYDFGDLDGDGDLDLLGANSLPGSAREMLLVNNGSGSFSNQTTALLPTASNPSIDDNDSKFLDIDMDGDLDFIIASLGSTERVCINNGGTFTLATGTITAIGDSSLDIDVGDFDGNGSIDIVTAQGESGSFVNRIFMNNGVADNRAPTFPQLEQLPDTMDTAGPYIVRVAIRDDMTGDNGFHRLSTTLTYSVNGGTPIEIPLRHSGHDMFRGEIPGLAGGSVVTYQAHATDWNNNSGDSAMASFTVLAPPTEFLRGDVNNDGDINALTDGLFMLNFGFIGGSPVPPCSDAADVDGSGVLSPLIDTLVLLNFGFVPGSPPPAPPYPDCGSDPDGIGCDVAPAVCP